MPELAQWDLTGVDMRVPWPMLPAWYFHGFLLPWSTALLQSLPPARGYDLLLRCWVQAAAQVRLPWLSLEQQLAGELPVRQL